MPYDPRIHHRKSIRLPEYDYSSPGAYFVTIVTHRRICIFGEISDGKMILNENGQIAHAEWLKTTVIRPEIALDEFIIMPNHIHAIISIMEHGGGFVGAHGRAPLRRSAESLGSFVAGYKSSVTAHINQSRGTPGARVWQRNYWEHIIRNDRELS